MLRISSAASGEEVASVPVSELLQEGLPSVGLLKRFLAQRHFEKKYSRFQLRFLREGDPSELKEDEQITAATELQLMILSHLPPDEERDAAFLDSCGYEVERFEEVERSLRALQNPDLDPTWHVSPLSAAAEEGHSGVVRLLLEAGANTEWRTEAEGEDCQRTALHSAADAGYLEVVRLLLNFGANKDAANSSGRTALHLAAENGYASLVGLLLESGANKEANAAGFRPLHLAAMQGHLQVVTLLLDSGAHKEAMGKGGYRPLHCAAKRGHTGVLRRLLDSRAEVDAEDITNMRPLHLAADKGLFVVVHALLASGAEKAAQDSFGRTPGDLASANGHQAVARLLKNPKRRRVESSSETS